MDIEIKMFGGAYQDGKAPADTLGKVGYWLNDKDAGGDFVTLETPRGPVLINKRNILSVKKK